jgi:hypothetical protein
MLCTGHKECKEYVATFNITEISVCKILDCDPEGECI